MLSRLLYIGLGLAILRLVGQVFYNLFLHPLRKYPGPLIARGTRFSWIWYTYHGRLHTRQRELHERYGPVVRIAPNELAFSDAAAWKDIYGHRIGEHGHQDENEKWIVAYAGSKKAPRSLLSAPRAEHTYLRRLLSHGFSDRSLREQESMIRGHMDTLISQLRVMGVERKERVNIKDWISYTTFDIIGDLALGTQFECLRKPDHREWIKPLSGTGSRSAIQGTLRRMVLPDWLCDYIKTFASMNPQAGGFQKYVRLAVLRRMEWTAERPDLIEGLLVKEKEKSVSTMTMMLTAGILLGAGFETTSSIVCATMYLLQRNPECLKKINEEVRGAFGSPEDITFSSVDNLPYLRACLSEALRWYPPIASGLPREVMKGGTSIAGEHVPEGAIVSIHHWASYHSSIHFREPDQYRPERWLDDPKFASDNLDLVQPFMVGPRNCLGKNLAVAEMRSMLALLLYNFDFKMPEEYVGWAEKQKFYTLWDRPALEMYLTPAKAVV